MGEINELIHQPVRLRMLSILAGLEDDADVEFMFLRNQLAVSSGNLGAHLDKVVEAGYVAVHKTFVGRRPKTFIRLTTCGRRAFEDHVEALKRILGQGQR
jgi:DNA-binding MarR family transcriptional regulator